MENSQYKAGDIVMGFGDPKNSKRPLGQVRLKTHLQSTENLELWFVEYLDQPEHFYELWLKKQKNGKNNSSTKDNSDK